MKKWILIGDEDYKMIINSNFKNQESKFKLKIIKNLSELRFIDYEKNNFEGIIISSNKLEEDFDFSFLQLYNLSLISLKDWCKIYLQRYPPEFLTSLDILKITNF